MKKEKWKAFLSMVLAGAAALSFGTAKAGAKSAGGIFTSRPSYVPHVCRVYLSPSCQTWNPYSDGSGSEEYHMRQVAEAMVPCLNAYGIESVLAAAQTGDRSNQRSTIVNRAKQASTEKCDLYLAIHSNARDDGPKTYGTTIFYPTEDARSLRFANLLKGNFIYPDKSAISLDTKDALWEMYMPKMPHCLIETAYHDNPGDVQWIETNINAIAQSLATCVAMYEYAPVAVEMDRTSVSMKAGKTCELNSIVTLINANTYENRTSWSSYNSKVAMVQNGTVLGVSKGCTTIEARTGNGLTAKCLVTVT